MRSRHRISWVSREPKQGKKQAKLDNSSQGIQFFDSREYDENPGEYTYGVPQLLRLMNSKLPPACDSVAQSAMQYSVKEKAIEHLYLIGLSATPLHPK